jgi:hypothetical protein
MKDILTDIVAHTHALSFLNLLKITAEPDKTVVEARDGTTLVMYAETKVPVAGMQGVIGMGDLQKLSYHLKNPEYETGAVLTVVEDVRNGQTVPVSIHFENAQKNFKNDYRFIFKEVIEKQVPSSKFKGASWDADFVPAEASIQRLKRMAGGIDETIFQTKVEGDNLNLYFGDNTTHAGSFTFQKLENSSLKQTFAWPVTHFMSILSLTGNKRIQISNGGVMKISVDSNLAVYEYYIMAQTK